MNRMILAGLATLVLSTGGALAQTCTVVQPLNKQMTQAQLGTLLTNRYACVGTSPTAQWNELHSGGNVIDYKLGPAHPTDPTATVGTYVISGLGNPQTTGTVTYNYTGGGSYGYNVYGPTPVGPGVYSFCGVSGGAPNLLVTISAAHC